MYFDFNYILNQLGSVGIADVFDIIIVAFVFYYLFKFVRERRAGKLAIGVLFLIAGTAQHARKNGQRTSQGVPRQAQ